MEWTKATRICFVTLLIFLMTLLSESVFAQFYFGRNKIQYEDFNFKVLKSENFDVYFYPREARAAEDAARIWEFGFVIAPGW